MMRMICSFRFLWDLCHARDPASIRVYENRGNYRAADYEKTFSTDCSFLSGQR